MRSINLFVCVFIALVSCEDPEPFEIIENHVKFLNDTTGRVIEDLQLGYYFSVETGGYTNKVYHGKICKAYHPDQFYENCYQKRKGEDLIWYMTKSAIDPKYDETKLTQCFWEEDGFCRYKDQNGKTIYLSDVIIVDSDIVFDERPNSVFGLLKFFENSDNVLILETFFRLPKIIDFKEVSVNVHHLIDFNCPLLSREMKITMTLIVGYCIVLSLWSYRNLIHHPNTNTFLHRIMTGPPIIKFFLMVTSYLVFFTCPWNNANVKVYIILIKILLNLIFESVLVGSLFLISIGFKIARSDISMFHFAVLLFIMLFNYLVIFVLIVFNEFYSIGTILYTTVNFILMIYLTLNFVNVLSKLKMFRRVAQNSRYPSQAIEIKIRIMKQAMIVVFIFFFLEVFYHGILAVFRIPSTREGDRNFFTCHEITDFIIVTCLLYIVRAREYIPYYGIINIDNEIGIDGDLEMQHLSKGEILSFNIDLLDKEEYSGENSDHEEIKPKDVVLILDPEGPNSEDQSFAKMTFPSKQLDILRKLGVGVCQDPSQIKEKQEL